MTNCCHECLPPVKWHTPAILAKTNADGRATVPLPRSNVLLNVGVSPPAKRAEIHINGFDYEICLPLAAKYFSRVELNIEGEPDTTYRVSCIEQREVGR